MTITSFDIAASIAKTCRDIALAMDTYERAPKGMRLRDDIIVAIDQLHERLGHQLACLARKHCEEK